MKVCPACDGPRPPKIERKVYADADHFLPQSQYPFLSVHPANLVPTCSYCNERFKVAHDPLNDKKTIVTLADIFHPYGRAAIHHINVNISTSRVGVHQIQIEDKSGMPSRRVNDLQRIFKLNTRWPEDLKTGIDQIQETLRYIREAFRTQQMVLSEDVLRSSLNDMLKDKTDRVGEGPFYILQTSYLRYALSNEGEFKELYDQFNNRL